MDIKSENECWNWTDLKQKDGYARMSIGNKMIYAHRIAYTLGKGEIPRGLLVLHSCDNPSCCNPSHLFVGTDKDNAEDRDRKGRLRLLYGDDHWTHKKPELLPHGENHWGCKVTSEQVEEMKRLYDSGMSFMEVFRIVSQHIDIGYAQVNRILNGESRKYG